MLDAIPAVGGESDDSRKRPDKCKSDKGYEGMIQPPCKSHLVLTTLACSSICLRILHLSSWKAVSRSHGPRKSGGGFEAVGLASLDLDGFAGAWVEGLACFGLPDCEGSERGEGKAPSFFSVLTMASAL
jgi:hypothetical protein